MNFVGMSPLNNTIIKIRVYQCIIHLLHLRLPLAYEDNKSVADVNNKSVADVDNKSMADVDNKSMADVDFKSVAGHRQ